MHPQEEAVYRTLSRTLLAGRLAPGTQLVEMRLAEVFGVSRERVRKVLHRLGHERLLELVPKPRLHRLQPHPGAGPRDLRGPPGDRGRHRRQPHRPADPATGRGAGRPRPGRACGAQSRRPGPLHPAVGRLPSAAGRLRRQCLRAARTAGTGQPHRDAGRLFRARRRLVLRLRRARGHHAGALRHRSRPGLPGDACAPVADRDPAQAPGGAATADSDADREIADAWAQEQDGGNAAWVAAPQVVRSPA